MLLNFLSAILFMGKVNYYSSEPSETFQTGSGQPFTTVNVKSSIFWAAYLVPGLFNSKHKPFISTVLVDANQLF